MFLFLLLFLSFSCWWRRRTLYGRSRGWYWCLLHSWSLVTDSHWRWSRRCLDRWRWCLTWSHTWRWFTLLLQLFPLPLGGWFVYGPGLLVSLLVIRLRSLRVSSILTWSRPSPSLEVWTPSQTLLRCSAAPSVIQRWRPSLVGQSVGK